MHVEIEDVSPCRRKLSIEVPAEEVSKEFDEVLDLFVNQVQIPGFRPGRAPRKLVKSRHQKDILSRLRDHLLPKSYQEALKEHDLAVVNILDMDEDIQVKEGEPFSYSITVDIQPKIELPDYKGFKLKHEAEKVTKEEVNERIDAIREQRAEFEDITDQPVSRGDMVQIDFTGTLDGKPLEEAEPEAKGLGEGKDFWLPASDEAFIPEMGTGLDGLAIGDKTTVDATFPDDFVVENLRGKQVSFEMEVKAIRARKLPELDEAFFESLGVEDAGAFKKQVKDSLGAEKDRAASNKMREQIEEELLKRTSFDLPESLVEQSTSQHIQRMAEEMQRGGLDEEKLLEQKDQLVEGARARAERQVRLRLILLAIAREEDMQVSDADFKRELQMMAYAYSMQADELERRLKENNQLDDLRGDILCRRVLQMIQDLSRVDEASKENA